MWVAGYPTDGAIFFTFNLIFEDFKNLTVLSVVD